MSGGVDSGSYLTERSDASFWQSRKTAKFIMTDDSEVNWDLGFSFPFSSALGTRYPRVRIGTNGGLRFLLASQSTGEIGYHPTNFPGESNTNYAGHPNLAPFWADFYPDPSSGVYRWGQSNVAVFTWENMLGYFSSGSTRSTFQAALFATGDVVYHYGALSTMPYQTFGINDPRDPNEPTIGTIHTSFWHQAVNAPLAGSTAYYFVTERY